MFIFGSVIYQTVHTNYHPNRDEGKTIYLYKYIILLLNGFNFII